MQRKSAEFGEIYDVYAIRLLVDEVHDCYAALGIVHSIWRPIPGQFDDYIAVPKNNLYQSLHTAVIALDGKPLEIQIRTHQMHQVTEVGIAAHWRYKEGTKSDREYDAKLAWLRQLMDWQRDVSDATEFVEGIKLDIFQDQVFVFTPEGRHQGPAGRRDAARLRLPHPHRRRPPHDRRQGQQPARAARLPAQERRHRRDRHDQGRARPVARLAERRPDQPRPREDPPMVQAQGPRREHRPRPRVARARAAPAGPDVDRDGRRGPHRRGRQALQLRDPRRLLRRDRLRRGQRPVGGHAPRRRRRRAERRCRRSRRRSSWSAPAASGSRASATSSSGSPSAATRSRATRSSGSSPAARASPSTCGPVRRSSTSARSAGSSRSSGRPSRPRPTRSPSGSRRTTGRACCRDITQVVAENKVNIVAAQVAVTPDHTAVVTATLQVHSVSQLARVMSRIETLKDVISVQRDLG